MGDLLFGGLVGALIGIALERVFSVLGGVLQAVKYRGVRGTYEIVGPEGPNGLVTISGGFGNRFIDTATGQRNRDWTGMFSFDESAFGVAQGTYRHHQSADDQPDWGYHHLMLMPDGNFAVQWENVSHAQDSKGAVLWVKRDARSV